ncbi:uncharacterized protein LOC120345741 [Styela clava]
MDISDQSTTSNKTGHHPSEHEIFRQWLAAIVFASFLLVWSLYILIVTLMYEWKVMSVNFEIKQRSLKRSRHRGRIKFERNKTADRMRYLIIITAVFTVLRQCLEGVELRHSFDNDEACNSLRVVKNILYAFCASPIYIVLWMRQRVFYESPVLKDLSNKGIRILSFSIVLIMGVGDAVGILLFIATRGYKSSPTGCKVEYSHIPKKLPGVFLFSCTATFQIILMGLFAYPLLRHKHESKDINADCSGLMKLLKRTTIMAAITICCDGIGALITMLVSDLIIAIFRQLIYDFMLLIATVCVIASFGDWKIRLLPFLKQKTKVQGTIKQRNSSDVSTGVTNLVSVT